VNIAWFSPLPPARTGIADYSRRLIRLLADQVNLDCFHDQESVDREALPSSVGIFPYVRFPHLSGGNRYDLVVYQCGNSAHHEFVFFCLRHFPGVIDLHDPNVHHAIAHVYSRDENGSGYRRILDQAYGNRAGLLGRLADFGLFHESQAFQLPLAPTSPADGSALIVHSNHAVERMRRSLPRMPIAMIPPPIEVGPESDPDQLRQIKTNLGLKPDSILVGAFGEVLRKKGSREILGAFRALASEFPSATLAFVGPLPERESLSGVTPNDRDNPRIRFTGRVDWESWRSFLRATDIGINLRFPSVGETSQTLLELMAEGKPVLVTDIDAAKELPPDAVIKVSPGATTLESQLTSRLRELLSGESTRRDTGQRARRFILDRHAPARIKTDYLQFLQSRMGESKLGDGSFGTKAFDERLTRLHCGILAKKIGEAGWQSTDSTMLPLLFPE
jgi:glycosyltransferase involved in cell wall biosynthesis